MRAGLLSEPVVIERINETFVPTWILVDDARALALQGDDFARNCSENWEFPLDLMFFNPDGTFVNKLNSFRDLRAAHEDVGHPPEGRGRDAPHLQVFLDHVEKNWGTGSRE